MSRPRRFPFGRLIVALGAVLVASCSGGEQGVIQAQAGDGVVSLSEGPCHDACPVYDMTLHASGAYVLNSERFVKSKGVSEGNLGKHAFVAAEAALKDAGFWELKPRQTKATMSECMAETPTVKITWRTNEGKEKTVTYEAGCGVAKMRELIASLRGALKFDDLVWTDEKFAPDGSR
jgi:Domain of unknown function (DUF6438)